MSRKHSATTASPLEGTSKGHFQNYFLLTLLAICFPPAYLVYIALKPMPGKDARCVWNMARIFKGRDEIKKLCPMTGKPYQEEVDQNGKHVLVSCPDSSHLLTRPRVIAKDGKWSLAQKKTEGAQAPLADHWRIDPFEITLARNGNKIIITETRPWMSRIVRGLFLILPLGLALIWGVSLYDEISERKINRMAVFSFVMICSSLVPFFLEVRELFTTRTYEFDPAKKEAALSRSFPGFPASLSKTYRHYAVFPVRDERNWKLWVLFDSQGGAMVRPLFPARIGSQELLDLLNGGAVENIPPPEAD